MPSQYAPLPTENQHDEMDAAFETDSEDEDELDRRQRNRSGAADTAPLLAHTSSSTPHPLAEPAGPSPIDTRSSAAHPPSTTTPGGYNFEYDYPPPPGSPPPAPTAYGNTNGYVPVFSGDLAQNARPNIFRRAMGALLPSHYVRDQRGSGVHNDGVFSNLTAKPTATMPGGLRDPVTGLHVSPEETQKEAPPSYAAAQLDAVPPYWETTIIAPGSPNGSGDLIIDQLPTGSLFSFLWNLLVSMSFQFVGFLLTYLLHTTHAAKFGSRAGLGITLIQYGFYLRSRPDNNDTIARDSWGWPITDADKPPTPSPTFGTAQEADAYFSSLSMGAATAIAATPTMGATPTVPSAGANSDIDIAGLEQTVSAANEWVSFFLMTMGWFVLLTSLLGYWRVKRWERGIRQAAAESARPAPSPPTDEDLERERQILSGIEAAFGLGPSNSEMLRNGLGFGPATTSAAARENDESRARRDPRFAIV